LRVDFEGLVAHLAAMAHEIEKKAATVTQLEVVGIDCT